jgi:hypothetical protein
MVGDNAPNPEKDLSYDALDDQSESEAEPDEEDEEFWENERYMRDEY